MKLITRSFVLAGLTLAAFTGAGAQVTVGTNNSGNSLPFSYDFTSRYEQVYSSGQFPMPINIGALTFYNSRGGGNFRTGVFDFFLSTTSKAVGGLSSDQDANITGTEQAFTSVALSGSAAAPSYTFSGTPFLYDPAAGNLLLDIRFTRTANSSTPLAYFDADGSGTVTSRVYGPYPDNFGLVTRFSPVSTVPEPSSMALLGTGLIGLVPMIRRRRRNG